MQAAGTLPAIDAPAKTAADAPPQTTVPPASAAGPRPTRPSAPAAGPPLAKEGHGGWQAAPDPPAADRAAPPDQTLKIRVPSRFGRDVVAFAGPASPFVALGSNDFDGVRELWDITANRRVGIIRDPIQGIQRAAISPDGRWLACTSSAARGKIEVWSFQTGKRERQIDLGQEYASTYGLDFAGPDRIVASVNHEKGLLVWDVLTGQRIAKVDVYANPQPSDYAISPGGSYLALAKNYDRIELHDLRNGAFAGDVNLRDNPNAGSLQVQALAFSADGAEFAALAKRLNTRLLLCWSMKDGTLLADHKLSDELPHVSILSSNSRCDAIQWLPNQRGWVLLGVAIVDRQNGGPVWVDKDRNNLVRSRPFRVLDENRLLVLTGELDAQSLETVKIPWETIQEGKRIVESGGSVADVGLPPVTPADWSSVAKSEPPGDGGAYKPIAAGKPAPRDATAGVLLTAPLGLLQKSLLAASKPNLLLVNGALPIRPSSLAEISIRHTAPVSDVYDLSGPKHLFRFEAPFPTELVDFSPSGNRGLFREVHDQTRLDIYDLASRQHVVGFRPFHNSPDALQRKISWAAFADDEHVLTLGYDARLVLWKIPDVQAVYAIPATTAGKAYFDRSRNCLALPTTDGLRLIEPLTGRGCGLLTYPDEDARAVTSAAFRQDGRRLAAWFYQKRDRRLVVWDLESSKVVCDLSMPCDGFTVSWCGPDHVLVHNTESRQDMERGNFQVTLIDVAAPRVAWHYRVGLFKLLVEGPDDRCWYFAADPGANARRLVAVALPDPKAQQMLAATPAPRPAFGDGTPVALKIHVGAMPDGLEDRREREDELIRNLTEHFTDAVEAVGAKVAPQAPVTLSVSVKNLTEDDIVRLRSRYRLRSDFTIVLTKSTVRGHLSLATPDGTVLWSEEKLVGSGDVTQPDATKGLPLGTAIHVAQWQLAKQWCLEVPLPKVLYHPDAHRGVGESQLTASGIQFLRTLSPGSGASGRSPAKE